MRVFLAIVALAALSACSGPYEGALVSPVLARPQPPVTLADQRAVEPYDSAPYFKQKK